MLDENYIRELQESFNISDEEVVAEGNLEGIASEENSGETTGEEVVNNEDSPSEPQTPQE